MTDPASKAPPAAAEDLRRALEEVLGGHFGSRRRVTGLERRPSPHRTGFAIEHLHVTLDDGSSVDLIFKDLSQDALLENARKVKPSFLYDPLREIETYRSVLARAGLGTATCYGASVDDERGRYWLFLEDVPGVALWQIGELASWEATARWLGRLHGLQVGDGSTTHLLRYDGDFYRLWINRAKEFARHREPRRDAAKGIEWIAERYEQVVELLISLPVTVIHGDFYASNVLVATDAGNRRICPIDWEVAAIGPGLIDVAALTTGRWTDSERQAIALAYGSDALSPALDYCRLHLSVQWLGWSADWKPPRKQRQDWLSEAIELAEKLDL